MLVFPGVCNLHKHSFFFLHPIGPFVQYSLRPTEKGVHPRTQLRTLDISLEKYGQIITILLLLFVAHRIAQEPK